MATSIHPDKCATWLAKQVYDAHHTDNELYHAIGLGDPAWDALPSGPPDPDTSDTKLEAEIHRKQPQNVAYAEDVTGTATDGSTSSLEDTSRTEADHYFDGLTLEMTSGVSLGVSAIIVDWNLVTKTFTFGGGSFPLGIAATDIYKIHYALAGSESYALQIKTQWNDVDTFADGDNREEGIFTGTGAYSYVETGLFTGTLAAGDTTINVDVTLYANIIVGDFVQLHDISTGDLEYRRVASKAVVAPNNVLTLEGELEYDYVAADADTIKRYALTEGYAIRIIRDTKYTKNSTAGMLKTVVIDFRGEK